MDFPISVFNITGNNGHIKLSIEEVYGFPDEISYGGGYGARGILDIKAGNYSVVSQHSFTTGELYDFYTQLNKCYEDLSGTCILRNVERELNLVLEFKKTGSVIIHGDFQETVNYENKLYFEFDSDQSCISLLIKQLLNIQKLFGDKNGIN